MYPEFSDDIRKFNDLYKLPCHEQPITPARERIAQFIDILKEELEEGHEIMAKYEATADKPEELTLDILTELSDWLGDIIVYAASEARRAGLPLPEVLRIIMASNFSKLSADGRPIYDERGKVMKGPHYWKPEGKIRELVKETLGQARER